MASQDRSTALRVERMGMGLVGPAAGLAAMAGVLSGRDRAAVFTAVPFKWQRFVSQLPRGTVPAMFAAVSAAATSPAASTRAAGDLPPAAHPAVTRASASSVAAPAALAAAAAASGRQQTADQLLDHLTAEVQGVACGILGSEVGASEPLMAAGLDSLTSVEFQNSLEAKLGVELPTTLVFDYPTVAAIAHYLAANRKSFPVSAAPVGGAAAAGGPGAGAASAEAAAAHAAAVRAEVADVVRSMLGARVADDAPLMSEGLDSLSSGGPSLQTFSSAVEWLLDHCPGRRVHPSADCFFHHRVGVGSNTRLMLASTPAGFGSHPSWFGLPFPA